MTVLMFTNAEVPAFSAVMLSPEYQGEKQRAAWCSSFHPALEHPYAFFLGFRHYRNDHSSSLEYVST